MRVSSRFLSQIPIPWKFLAPTGHVYEVCPIRVLLFTHGAYSDDINDQEQGLFQPIIHHLSHVSLPN